MSHWTFAQQKLYRRQVALLNQASGGHYGDGARRLVLERVTRKASTGDIDRDEMTAVIREQAKLLRQFGIKTERKAAPRRMTQVEYLDSLVERLGWDDARLAGFIQRQTQGWHRSVETLDQVERSKMITALSAVLRDIREGAARADRPADARPRHSWTPEVVPGGIGRGGTLR